MPSFRAIRNAIVHAPVRPVGFPLHGLLKGETRQTLRAAPHLHHFLSDIRDEAARASTTPLEPLPFRMFRLFETTGDRLTYERPYFDRYRRLASLTLTSVIDETDEYVPALSDLIWEICNDYTWALPAHIPVGLEAVQANRVPPEQVVDLFAAHVGHALAEVLALLGDRLDPWLHYRVRNEIEQRIFQPIFHDPRHFHWESVPMNWSAVCAGCAGMAALALEDDRERLAGMIDRVVGAMECFLEGFGDDGGCPEGVGYWTYGFGFYIYFAETLHEFTGGALDLLEGDKIKRIAEFPNAISLGNNSYVNYSDAPDHAHIHPGLGARLAARLGEAIPDLLPPEFHVDHCYRWGHISRDLVWSENAALSLPVSDGTFYLSNLAWLISRQHINSTMVAFSAKGGHNGEPHNHNDLSQFILHVGGENLLADLGAGVYTRQYFGPQRYESLHTGSHGHSVPLINGQTQRAGEEHSAQVMHYEQTPDGTIFTLDLTRAYANADLASFIRSFKWSLDKASHSAKLELTDRFVFTTPRSTIEECFISKRRPVIEAGTATWQADHGTVTLHFAPEQFAPIIETLPTQAHLGEPFSVYRLLLRSVVDAANAEYTVLFDCRPSG